MKVLMNKGLIDLDVIKLMGVNVKEGEDSIGMFGTGLKYAISVFLRHDVFICMYRGMDQFTFGTTKKNIRGKDFDVCVMFSPYDCVELGFTTELGKNWDLWQAYREIHSNCLDEGGQICDVGLVNDSRPKEDCTIFCIDLDINEDDIFLNKGKKEVIYTDYNIEIFEGKSSCIFYRGIRAKDLSDPSIYTYNILKDCKLTEDRLICYDSDVSELIAETVSGMNDKDTIKSVISAEDETYERKVSHHFAWSPSPSREFNEAVKESPKVNSQFLDYAKKHEPLQPLTDAEKRQSFTTQLNVLCEQHDISIEDSETMPTVLTLSGGVLGADKI